MSVKNAYVNLLLNAINDQNIDLIKQIVETRNLIKSNDIIQISNTAFNSIALNGNIEIAKILVNYGFKLNNIENVKSPLHIACEHGYLQIVKFLINTFNLRLDLKDDLKMTPLHWAVEYGHYETINYILSNHLNQINFNLVDKFNRTIHELALIRRNNKIINLIEEKIKYKNNLDQSINVNNDNNNNIFNKTQFNIKSFAKPIKIPTVNTTNSIVNNIQPNINNEIITLDNDDEENLFKMPIKRFSTSPLSVSPNSIQMNETLNWLENQIYSQTNASTSWQNNIISSNDLIDELQNGRELVLTEAGKSLLELTDDRESTKVLLDKLVKSFDTTKDENEEKSKKFEADNENFDEDEDDDDLYMTNVVKRCRFSASPKSQTNQFDIDLDSFINNFLNSR